MKTPYWITPINQRHQTFLNYVEKQGDHNVNPSERDRAALLSAYLKMREAVEKAPHNRDCAIYTANSFTAGWDVNGMPTSSFTVAPCSCWKSQTLNFVPEGV
jgi:hypothetical protein